MAKKKKGAYKCGACGKIGHNARTCPSKKAKKAAKSTPKPEPKPEKVVEPEAPKAPVRPSHKVALSRTVDLTSETRLPKDPRPITAGQYQCPRCNQVATLVLVELEVDGTGRRPRDLRCEKCLNKTKVHEIIIWGASPDDAPSA